MRRPLLAVALLMLGCEAETIRNDRRATEETMQEMRAQVGLPNIVNFTEAKFARQIAELRDQQVRTWTYYLDLNGNRHLLCESVGYALPYSVQLTNPQQRIDGGGVVLPQAEPNGLYMPESADATWVLCSDGRGGIAPIYSEPLLIVSPYPLGHVDAASGSGWNETVEIERLENPLSLQDSE